MKPLTKEQRAAKFASKNAAPGLRSRGHRKLSLEEQRMLLKELKNQPPQNRVDNLRILREAIRSSDQPDGDLERAIYEQSVKECICVHEFENVVHILGHLCTIASASSYWRRLYVVALTNVKQFESALQHCQGLSDEQYIAAVLNMDVPRWTLLTRAQADKTCHILMEQLRPEIEAYSKQLEIAYKRPAQVSR